MIKNISLSIALFLFGATYAHSSNTISASSLSMHRQDTSRIIISMSNDVRVNGLNIIIKFDPNILILQSITPVGRALSMSSASGHNYLADKVSLVIYDAHHASIAADTGSIFSVTFTPRDSLPGDTSTQFQFLGGAVADSDLSLVTFNYINGAATITGVREKPQQLLPHAFQLYQNYPNPFNPTTTLRFDVPSQSYVTFKVYNILGQLVRSLLENRVYEPGHFQESFDGSNLSSGVYFYRLEATGLDNSSKSFTRVKKMLLLR